MAPKFKIGDTVKVPDKAQVPSIKSWWLGKEATVRAVLEESPTCYEVLFHDAQDFDFIEEDLLAPAADMRNTTNGS